MISGPFKYQVVVDFSGKVLKVSDIFQKKFGRNLGERLFGPSVEMTEETRQRAFRVLREALFKKHHEVQDFKINWKDGRSLSMSGRMDVIDWDKGEVTKALEIKGKIHELRNEQISNHNKH